MAMILQVFPWLLEIWLKEKKIFFMTSWSLHSTDTAIETSNHISVYPLLMEKIDGTQFFHDILLNYQR